MKNNQREELLSAYAMGERDFHGMDLSNIDLNHCELPEIDFSYANLSYANLSRANLSHTNLSHANLSHAKCENSTLNWANLSHADAVATNLKNATAKAVDLTKAILIRADAQLAMLMGATMLHTNATAINLEQANLECAHLEQSNLNNANLVGAVLSWSNLEHSSFNWSNMSWTLLEAALLDHANLTGAKLLASDLSYASLDNTILNGADLSYAQMLATLIHPKNSDIASAIGAKLNAQTLERSNWQNAQLIEWLKRGSSLLESQQLPTELQHSIHQQLAKLWIQFSTKLTESLQNTIEILISTALKSYTDQLHILYVQNHKNVSNIAFQCNDDNATLAFVDIIKNKSWQQPELEKKLRYIQSKNTANPHQNAFDIIEALNFLSQQLTDIHILLTPNNNNPKEELPLPTDDTPHPMRWSKLNLPTLDPGNHHDHRKAVDNRSDHPNKNDVDE